MSDTPNRRILSADQSDSVSIWMPLFIKDHRAAASTLTHIEHSALCYFKMLLWDNAGMVPNDDKFLARHLRLTLKQWRDMRDTILHDCTISGSTISDQFTIKEVEKAKAYSDQKRRAAKARWSKNADANGMRTHSGRNAHGMPRAGGGDGDGVGSPIPSQGITLDGGVVPFRSGGAA